MTCLGWIPIEFHIGNRVSKQALYICDKVDRIYFSRSGCVEVGIIPREFPHPMEELNVVDTNNAKEDTEHATHGLKHVREAPLPVRKDCHFQQLLKMLIV